MQSLNKHSRVTSLIFTVKLHFSTPNNFKKYNSILQNQECLSIEMFVRMLAVHCDQDNSYAITMSWYQARKINELRNLILGLQLWETFPSVRAEVEMLNKLSTWWNRKILGKPCLYNEDSWPNLLKRKIWNKLKIPFALLSYWFI